MTLTLTVQEPLAGMVAPAGEPKVRLVDPAVGAHVGGGVPPQVVVAAGVPATCNPLGRVSVKVASFSAMELELESVKVNVEVPFTAIGLGKKALVSVGGFGIAQPVNVTLSTKISDPEALLPAL